MSSDQVILLDDLGNEIGVIDKVEAHRNPAKLHRAVSVWLTDGNGKTLLQKRSKYKIVGAGWWANAVCGNVRPAETAEECAQRRLREELGITGAEIASAFTFFYKAYGNDEFGEHESDEVFIGNYSGEVQPNPKEVADYAWVDLDELIKNAKSADFPSPEDTLIMDESLLQSATAPLNANIGGNPELLTPWTVLMLRDPRLSEQFA